MQYLLPTLVGLAMVTGGFMFVRSMLAAARQLQSGSQHGSGVVGPDFGAVALGMTDWGAAAPNCGDGGGASCAGGSADGGG